MYTFTVRSLWQSDAFSDRPRSRRLGPSSGPASAAARTPMPCYARRASWGRRAPCRLRWGPLLTPA